MNRDGVRIFIVLSLILGSAAFLEIRRGGSRLVWVPLAALAMLGSHALLARRFPEADAD